MVLCRRKTQLKVYRALDSGLVTQPCWQHHGRGEQGGRESQIGGFFCADMTGLFLCDLKKKEIPFRNQHGVPHQPLIKRQQTTNAAFVGSMLTWVRACFTLLRLPLLDQDLHHIKKCWKWAERLLKPETLIRVACYAN